MVDNFISNGTLTPFWKFPPTIYDQCNPQAKNSCIIDTYCIDPIASRFAIV